jgi:hypothetical protein
MLKRDVSQKKPRGSRHRCRLDARRLRPLPGDPRDRRNVHQPRQPNRGRGRRGGHDAAGQEDPLVTARPSTDECKWEGRGGHGFESGRRPATCRHPLAGDAIPRLRYSGLKRTSVDLLGASLRHLPQRAVLTVYDPHATTGTRRCRPCLRGDTRSRPHSQAHGQQPAMGDRGRIAGHPGLRPARVGEGHHAAVPKAPLQALARGLLHGRDPLAHQTIVGTDEVDQGGVA